jgi:cytochrome P450
VSTDVDADTHADLTSHDTFVAGVPHATFRRLRREEPVAWYEEVEGNAGFWAVTRYDDVLQVSREHETFTSTSGIRMEEMDPEESEARRTLMELDPPEHTRLRRLVNRGFTRRTVEAYEAAIREITRAVLDEALPKGEFDFTKEIGRELPMRMLGRLMGLPDEDLDELVSWGDAMIGNTDPEFTSHPVDLTDTDEFRLMPFRSPAALEVFRYADRMAQARRAAPRDDVVTRLLAPTPDGEPLTDLEFKNFFTLLVAAGNDTTRYTIAGSLDALIDHPEAMAHLQDHPEDLEVAVEELLRWTTVTMHFRRTANRDTELRGVPIRAGDKVVIWFVSANYDDDQFAAPYTFDIARQPNDHCSFGRNGPHFCLGAWLARMEVRVTFEELLPRLASIERTGPVEHLRSNFIHGIKHLPVRVERAS